MKILYRKPLLYPLVRLFWPQYDFDKDHVFTYGEKIYTKRELEPDVRVHEEVHVRLSPPFGLRWLHFLLCRFSKRYFYNTELPAFQMQYQALRFFAIDDDNERAYAVRLGRQLASQLYGLGITEEEAADAIINL